MTEERRYSDFDLLIEGSAEEGYRARVLDSPAGEAAGSFTLPFSDLELENFLLKVGRPRGTTRRLESPEMEATRQFGSRLYDAVFQDDLRLSLRSSIDTVERRGEGLRIRLRFSDTPELAALPWEYLFSESTDQFLVLSAWTPIVRYLDLTKPIDPLTVTGPLRILAMISSPRDYPTLDIEEEWGRVEGALAPLVESGAVVIERSDDATLGALSSQLLKNEYHIFHFLGHGGFDEKAGDGVLVLEDGQNRARVVTGRDLGVILHDHRSLRLAVLNACEGARAGGKDPFSGSAQSLVRKGIPGVVAMQFEITDQAAITFAQGFYGAVAAGLPVDAAVAEARRAIFGLGNDIEWGTPVLYLRGDGRLFEVPEAADRVPPIPLVGVATEETLETATKEDEAAPPPDDGDDATRLAAAAAAAAATTGAGGEAVADIVDNTAEQDTVPPEVPPAVPPDDGGDDGGDEPPIAPLMVLLTRKYGGLPVWGWLLIALAVISVIAYLLTRPDDNGDTTTTVTQTPTTATTTETTTLPPQTIAADGVASAARAVVPITVDGSATEWPDTAFHTTDHIIYTHPDILVGAVARAGTENDSRVRLAWDDEFLYVYAEVDDDVLSAPNSGNQIWRDDAIDLNISVLGPSGEVSERPDRDDFQITLSPRDPLADVSEGSVMFFGNGSAFSENVTDIADVTSILSDGGYALEAAIPWSQIGVTDPRPGMELGMLVAVFDNDGEMVGGETLQSEIKANTPGAEFQRPQTWGTFLLEG